MKIHLPKIKLPTINMPKMENVSHILIILALSAFVGFGATFGLRWALLAAVPGLILLGVAVGN